MTRIAAFASAALLATSSLALAGGTNEVDRGTPPVVVEDPGSSFSVPTSWPGSLGGGGAVLATVGAVALVGAALSDSDSGSH